MKVFACKRVSGYSGGLAIVAANSAEEAFEVFHTNEKYDWMLDHLDQDSLEYISDINRLESYYYKRKDWFELPMLTANVEQPCIIVEDGYTE